MGVPRSWSLNLRGLYDYIDSTLASLSAGDPDFVVDLANSSALSACTYANGTSGVGATLTGNSHGAMDTVDSVTPLLNKTYLLTAQSTAYQNGLYKLTTLGDAGTSFVLTRLETYDESAEMKQGQIIQIRAGTINAGTAWKSTFADGPSVGSTSLTFSRDPLTVTTNTAQTISAIKTFSAAPVFSAGVTASGAVAFDLSGSSAAFKTPTGLATLGGKVAYGTTVQSITDPGNAGAIPVTSDGVCNMTSTGAETRTLALPGYVGQRLVLGMDTDGGDIVITVASAFDQSAHTTITLNDAGDMVELVGATIGGVKKWRLVANLGATAG